MNLVKVAFINPPHADWSLANNFSYLMFQSHYMRFGKYPDKIQWLKAPYKFNRYKDVKEIYEDGIQDADIYLFSSYVWNSNIIDRLAQLVKKKHPNSITCVGGPQIGKNDPEYLASRWFYDFKLTPTKPGEVFVQDLLDSYFDDNGKVKAEDLSWEIDSKKTCPQFMPEYSIYEDHFDFLKETRDYARVEKLEPFSIIETTRGCPYKCSFCEWGGGIGGKVYKKPMDTVKRDILALKKAGFRDVYLTDANFGAFFDRDVEIFKFGWDNGVNLTDISTMKSKDLKRRIKLIDAWFNVVGSGPEKHSVADVPEQVGHPLMLGHVEWVSQEARKQINNDTYADQDEGPSYISVVPTVSLQSVSEEAMKVANRIDLSLEDKIKLSMHIRKRCHEQDFPVPAIELILAMPGSTLEDFYNEFSILWNFKAWTSYRHDYMFLPDSDLSHPEYIKKYKIEMVDVYTDLVDEDGVDNLNGMYRNERHHFKTISSHYSASRQDVVEMFVMNMCGNYLLENFYEYFQTSLTPSEFGKQCFYILKSFDEFNILLDEVSDILNPNTPVKNIKRINGEIRYEAAHKVLRKYHKIILSELFSLKIKDGTYNKAY